MKEEPQKIKQILPQKSLHSQTDVRNFFGGPKGIQVAHVDSLHANINYHFHPAQNMQNTSEHTSQGIIRDYYNLFVGYDPFERDHFLVDYSRALTEYMNDYIKLKYCGWKEEQIAEIKKLPAIITSERNRSAIDEQQGVFAFITKIRPQQNGVMVYFQSYFPVSMRLLQDNNSELGCHSEWELNRTHWAIKNIDLIEVLQDAGHNLF